MEEKPKKIRKYPRSVIFIVLNEFCERFSYYGLRAILALYLRDRLLYNDDQATVIYHVFTMFCYFFPLAGAIIADNWLGKYKTILYLSIVYATGTTLISLTAIPTLKIPPNAFTLIALLLIAFGTGGIKPCVSAFGGDQFKVPEQAKFLGYFFAVFYFSINAGSLISTFITPILRADVHCFGERTCFSLAFGVPGILMVTAIVAFVAGKGFYKMRKPSGNILGRVCLCIGHAIRKKHATKEKKDHWLDHAADKYESDLIQDIKSVLKVLVLFIPLPVFWALFDQQGSRWTFQATRMRQDIGSWTLKPDQMQVLNPLLVLMMLPLFEVAIYPCMTWLRLIRKPLHKMIWGGMLAAFAFVLSGIVELTLLPTYGHPVATGEAQLRLYNTYNCPFTVEVNNESITIDSLGMYTNLHIPTKDYVDLPYSLKATDPAGVCGELGTIDNNFRLKEKTANGFFINATGVHSFEDNNDKVTDGANIRFLSTLTKDVVINVLEVKKNMNSVTLNSNNMTQVKIPQGSHDIIIGGNKVLTYDFGAGAVYTINVFEEQPNQYHIKVLEITPPNTVHILWLIPQYVVISSGEVMFSVTGLEFSFTQAPVTMKSVLASMWLLTVTFGNLIVIAIVQSKVFDDQWKEFFLFAGLMFLDMLVFTFMALKYKYVVHKSSTEALPISEIKPPEKTPA